MAFISGYLLWDGRFSQGVKGLCKSKRKTPGINNANIRCFNCPFHKSWFMAVKHGMHLEKAETFPRFMSCVISTIFIFHGRRNPRIISGHYSTKTINHRRFNYFISRWTRINHFGREFARTLLFNFPRSYNYSLTTFPAELFFFSPSSPPFALLSSAPNNEAARWENVPLNNVKCFWIMHAPSRPAESRARAPR